MPYNHINSLQEKRSDFLNKEGILFILTNKATQVFHEDLKLFKKNGWALSGLVDAYLKMGLEDEVKATKELFDEAW